MVLHCVLFTQSNLYKDTSISVIFCSLSQSPLYSLSLSQFNRVASQTTTIVLGDVNQDTNHAGPHNKQWMCTRFLGLNKVLGITTFLLQSLYALPVGFFSELTKKESYHLIDEGYWFHSNEAMTWPILENILFTL